MLHHIEPKYSLKCCTYLIWFEFELKTLEKINRKGNRNSRKIGKANSAQGSPSSPARALVSLCLIGGSRLSVQARAPSLSRSLAAPWDRPVGAVALARARSLSLCPTDPPVSASLTSRPRSPRRGRARVRAFSGHDRAPAPLLNPAPCSPTSPPSFAPSAQLSRPLSRSAHANREPLPPPADVHRLFLGRRCVRAPSRATISFALPPATRDTLRCALTLSGLFGPRSPEWFLRSSSSATITPSRPCAFVVAPCLQRFPSR
jgi:hypothetical protein